MAAAIPAIIVIQLFSAIPSAINDPPAIDPKNEVLAIKPKTKFVEQSNPDILNSAQLKKLKFS